MMPDHDTELLLVKKDVKHVGTRVDLILDNHLPHLQSGVDQANDRINKLLFWMVMLLAGIIVSIWLMPLFKT